ncbi:MAG: ParB N-terminal domain-containing protein [Erysipelotrichaceae bacterium]|nr:ParB N-terminal domain-containing protein [Erysipelotrichaceae bacterium]
MEENVTRGLFNLDSLNEAAKGRVVAIDYYLLKENKLNDIYLQEDIDLLKENIEEFQLSQPIIVRKNADNSYTILSGHRRYKACKKIFAENKSLFFFDKEYINQIPCIVDNKQYKSEDDEFLAIVSSNAARVLSAEERKKIYLKLKEIYDRKCAAGERPKGKEREVISSWMGVTDRTVQNYKKELKQDFVQKQNDTAKIIKRFTGIEKCFTFIEIEQYDEEDIENIKQAAIPAINAVMSRLNIDTSEL